MKMFKCDMCDSVKQDEKPISLQIDFPIYFDEFGNKKTDWGMHYDICESCAGDVMKYFNISDAQYRYLNRFDNATEVKGESNGGV